MHRHPAAGQFDNGAPLPDPPSPLRSSTLQRSAPIGRCRTTRRAAVHFAASASAAATAWVRFAPASRRRRFQPLINPPFRSAGFRSFPAPLSRPLRFPRHHFPLPPPAFTTRSLASGTPFRAFQHQAFASACVSAPFRRQAFTSLPHSGLPGSPATHSGRSQAPGRQR